MTTGKLLSVDTYPAGSSISEAPTGDLLPVYDPFDFSPVGGQVSIGGVVYDYTGVDFDTAEVIGAASWPALDPDQPVLLEPYAETKYGFVQLSGDEGDSLQVLIPHALGALLEDGQRDPDNTETVEVAEALPGQWRMLDVLNRRAEVTAEAAPPSDGLAPASSPDATAFGGIGQVFVRWVPIENADPVVYQVHVALVPDFTPDETTLVVETPANGTTLKTLPNGDLMAYDTDYYFRVVATDADGAAAPGGVATVQLLRITGPDIAVDYVYAGNIIANQIIGGTINADLFMSGSIKTAEAGARVELGAFGFVVYDPAGVPTTLLGSDGLSTFKGQVQASTLDVTDGMSIRGTANELAQGGELSLAIGISASPNAPTVVADYEIMPGWQTGGGSPWPAGYEFKCIQRVGSNWLVGAREVATDQFWTRLWADNGSFVSYLNGEWTASQITRCAMPTAAHPAYVFRGTDRRIICQPLAENGNPETPILAYNFLGPGIPAGTTTGSTGTASTAVISNFLAITTNPNSSGWLRTTALQDLQGKHIILRIPDAEDLYAGSGNFNGLSITAPAGSVDNYISAGVSGFASGLRLNMGAGFGGLDEYSWIPFDPAHGSYIRVTESNGSLKLSTSLSGTSNWTVRLTIANHHIPAATLRAMNVDIYALQSAADTRTSRTQYFDDFSITWGWQDFGAAIPWVDTGNPPAMGSDGTNLLAAERTSDNRIKIYEIDPRATGSIVTTYTSGVHADFAAAVAPLVTVMKGSFDFGGTRFVVTEGSSGDQSAFVFTVSGTTLTYQRNESFHIPGQAGAGWDGTYFQTLATDGTRRKHTDIRWTDSSAWSKTWYAATTWYDGVGTTHETTPSPRAAFSLRKRQRYTVTSADIPVGGVDDPDRIRAYISTGAATTLYLQATTAIGSNSAVLTAATFSGTNPPVTNDFPAAVAATITSPDGRLVISGDGTIRAGEYLGFEGGAASVLAKPYLGLMDIFETLPTGGGVLTSTTTGVAWSRRFMFMGGGRHATYIPAGYFEVALPPDGTVIPVTNGGVSTVTVASGVVPLASWSTLYYEIPWGATSTSDATKFRIVEYSAGSNFTTPWGWVPIVTRNADSENATTGTHRWINGRLTNTVGKTNVQAVFTTGSANVTLTTSAQDLTGLTLNVPVAGVQDVFWVTTVFDFGATTGGNRAAVGQLVVGGSVQSAQAVVSLPTTGMRLSCSQSYRITSLSAGTPVFKGQVLLSEPGSPTGVLIVRPTHTTMTVHQIV